MSGMTRAQEREFEPRPGGKAFTMRPRSRDVDGDDRREGVGLLPRTDRPADPPAGPTLEPGRGPDLTGGDRFVQGPHARLGARHDC
jgi:hypothetical protein